MNYENENPASRARSPPPPLRTAQSMYHSPTAVPPHQPLRRVVTSPPVYHPPPVYGPDPNVMYGSPPPPGPMYGPPLPYIPHSHNTSMYYPSPAPQPQMIIPQPQMIPSYANYDPNFEAYFGPDVQSQPTQSPIEEQRKQFENYSRNRPIRSTNQYATRSGTLVASSEAEARALEEAIELSLAEVTRQGSVSQPSESGHTSRTFSTRSNDTWEADSTARGCNSNTNMTSEELADEKALQEAILASIREAELEQERDSKLPDDYDEDLCILAALRDSTKPSSPKNNNDHKDSKFSREAPVVPVLAVPVDGQYPYNMDSDRASSSTERTNSRRPLPPPPAYANQPYEDGGYENRGDYGSYERSTSAHRRRAQQPPREYAAEYYPEHVRRVPSREEAYPSPRLSPRSAYAGSEPRATLPAYESPRRDYPDPEARRSTPGYDSRERGLVQQALQSAQRYQLPEESYDRPKLSRRNSPCVATYEDATRRPSAGREYAERNELYRQTLSSPRDVYEAERYPVARRNSGDERGIVDREFQETDYYPVDAQRVQQQRPYPYIRSGFAAPAQYTPEHRSTSATRQRTAPVPAVWEDSDIPRGYEPQDPRRLAAATTKPYYGASSATGAATSPYDGYGKEAPARYPPSRQASRGSSMYYDSPRTMSEGSSAEEEDLQRMDATARGAPPGYSRAPPPVYGHATLRAPTPPPQHLLSGVKYA